MILGPQITGNLSIQFSQFARVLRGGDEGMRVKEVGEEEVEDGEIFVTKLIFHQPKDSKGNNQSGFIILKKEK